MSYLQPPPNSEPVIVMKDTGGLVSEYQARTEMYRLTNREVRLHECRSACTLALSLPNVCVFPGSLLKFHLAYNEITRQSDYGVSQQLFQAYPPAVRERLGGLRRQYQVLSGSELIKLGIRDCNEPRARAPKIMLAKATPQPLQAANGATSDAALGTMWHKVIGIFGSTTMPRDNAAPQGVPRPALAAPDWLRLKPADAVPLPPADEQTRPPVPPVRPHELTMPLPPEKIPPAPLKQEDDMGLAGREPEAYQKQQQDLPPSPPPRRVDQELFSTQTTIEPKLTALPWVKLMSGAQKILPARFTAYVRISMR